MNVLIVGGGKVGATLATRLRAAQHQVIVIEARQEHLEALGRDLPAESLVFGSGTDPDVLEAAGIRQAAAVAAVTGADETNLVVTSLARFEFGVPRTIARVNNPKNAWLFTAEMGVDVALDQADLIARMIIEEVKLPSMGA
jgi:trk system potassium uptake protein TrkA